MLFHLALAFTFTVVQGTFLESPGLYQVTAPVDHAEGPTWDARKGVLYFVNIHDGQVNCYNYFTDTVKTLTLAGDVAIAVPSKNDPNLLMIANNRSLVAVEWDGTEDKVVQSPAVITTVSEQYPRSRFNDGKADKEGRLWFGTMGYENSSGVLPNQGGLYLFSKSNLKNPQLVISPVNISNGLAWNADNTKFYYIDTPTDKVMEYTYDNYDGKISNPRVAFDLKRYTGSITGHPDGMTIDSEDNLWVALYGGGAVIKVNPNSGTLLEVHNIPARDITSAMFGGPNLDILFVTTSRYSLIAEQRLYQQGAGSVWALTNLGVTGVPVYEADVFDGAIEQVKIF